MKTVFRGAMTGQAGTWCRLLSDRNFELMRRRFLTKYWSVETQRNVVAIINSVSYNGDKDGTYEHYFLKWLNHARYLDNPINDEVFIGQMKWHFPEKVLDRIENRRPRNIDQAIELLASFNSNYFESTQQKARGKEASGIN